MPLHLPAADEAELRYMLGLGLPIHPTSGQGVPLARHWRSAASASLEAFHRFKLNPKAQGFMAALGRGFAVVTVRENCGGYAQLVERLGDLPPTATSRLDRQLRALWFVTPAAVPTAVLNDSVAIRAGYEGMLLPPSLVPSQSRWRWLRRPSAEGVGVSTLPQSWAEEALRLAPQPLAA